MAEKESGGTQSLSPDSDCRGSASGHHGQRGCRLASLPSTPTPFQQDDDALYDESPPPLARHHDACACLRCLAGVRKRVWKEATEGETDGEATEEEAEGETDGEATEGEAEGEKDGEATEEGETDSDDSGPESWEGLGGPKPKCMFTHEGPSTAAVEAYRKRQQDARKRQQDAALYDEGPSPLVKRYRQAELEVAPMAPVESPTADMECDHPMLVCTAGYSLIEDYSYIPQCPDCGQLVHVGHRGYCPELCGCDDYLERYPPSD